MNECLFSLVPYTGISSWNNRGDFIRRGFSDTDIDVEVFGLDRHPALALSGIPLYDHYRISFADGHIGIYRPGNDTPLMEIIDLDPLEVNYVGMWTGKGSVGYWRFPSLCV